MAGNIGTPERTRTSICCIRSAVPVQLDYGRIRTWLAAQESNLKPLRSERSALPDCASGQWQGVQELNLGGWVQRPAPNPFGQLPAKIEATVRGQYYSALMLPFPCRTVGKIGPVGGSRTHAWRATISRPGH
jgi:hypothetical protein